MLCLGAKRSSPYLSAPDAYVYGRERIVLDATLSKHLADTKELIEKESESNESASTDTEANNDVVRGQGLTEDEIVAVLGNGKNFRSTD